MIYGDNPQKINEREDKLGLKTYSYAPQISAIVQSGNLYVYCVNNPNYYRDPSGQVAIVDDLLIIGGIAAVCFFIAATPYLMEWARAMGKSMADLYRMSKRELTRLIDQANANKSAIAAPGAPDPNDDWNHRDYYLNKVKNPKLKNAIDQLYRENARIGDGGTADILRYEYRTGQPLEHLQKAKNTIKCLERILQTETLTEGEIKIVYQLLDDLYSAVKMVGG